MHTYTNITQSITNGLKNREKEHRGGVSNSPYTVVDLLRNPSSCFAIAYLT